MSVWGDIRRRADGSQIRKEDKFHILDEKEIREILESFQVGQNGCGPIRGFCVISMLEDNSLERSAILLQAIEHTTTISINSKVVKQTKTRDYNSDQNVNKLMNTFNKIIKLC